MSSIFDRAELKASRALDRVHGETVTILAMKSGINVKAAPDTARPDSTVLVVFVEEVDGEHRRDARHGDRKLDDVGGSHWLTVDLRSLATPLLVGDHVFRHKTNHKYRAKAISPDGEGRLKVALQLLSSEALTTLTN
ncbi:MAG: hypothetical protein VR78_11010 [Hoeflea sp. BRH_c9]|nr:MAG: hypothetical protein VR78_11010 [Hoeflea sp. BRH_c9]